jgi:hypothetical protein
MLQPSHVVGVPPYDGNPTCDSGWFCDRLLKRPLLTVYRTFMNVANRVVVKDGDYFEDQ